MAEGVHIYVEGLRAVVRDLERMGVSVEDLKESFGKLSQQGVSVAQASVPVRTGKLKASIRASKTKNRSVVYAGFKKASPYAGAIQYGWQRRGIEATHYMNPIDEQVAPRAVEFIEAEISRLITKYNLT